MRTLTAVLTTFLVATLALQTSVAAPTPIPVEIIGKLPVFEDPMISPNGQYLASRMVWEGNQVVVTQRLKEPGIPEEQPSVLEMGDKYFSWYNWANDERLIIGFRSTVGVRGRLFNLGRMLSIGRDAKDPVTFDMQPNDHNVYRQSTSVLNWLENDPDHILALLDDEPDEWASPRVHKVNVHTGERTLIKKNRKGFFGWIADYDGRIRVGTRYSMNFGKTDVEIYYRGSPDAKWEILQDIDYFEADRLLPYGFYKEDPNILLVTTNEERGEFKFDEDLYRYDLTERRIIGPHRDEELTRIRDLIENALPDFETEIVSLSRDRTVGFIRAYSDMRSPEYYLLDLNKGRLDYTAAEYPDLINFMLAPMQKREFTARDGRKIPLLLTLPVDSADQPLPAVVMPHGGPWAHDEWGFDNYVQFLASRGYVVLQPQFRGSTGYGLEHEQAGYGEWGKGIQDDITDATLWGIEEGLIDPERICIVGSSFGGYASAMGVVKEPDLFACAVSINGVLDLKKFVSDADFYLFENMNKKMWNDYNDTKPYSPYHRAKEIRAPILLIGSERDTVVPVKHHAQKMHKLLRKLEKSVEYLELPDDEHWRTNEANEITKLKAIEGFLDRYIGASAATPE